MPNPQPFTPHELRHDVAPLVTKIQQACDAPGLLVLDPEEAKTLRRLLYYLQHRPAK